VYYWDAGLILSHWQSFLGDNAPPKTFPPCENPHRLEGGVTSSNSQFRHCSNLLACGLGIRSSSLPGAHRSLGCFGATAGGAHTRSGRSCDCWSTAYIAFPYVILFLPTCLQNHSERNWCRVSKSRANKLTRRLQMHKFLWTGCKVSEETLI
jgi:hypothetical protein